MDNNDLIKCKSVNIPLGVANILTGVIILIKYINPLTIYNLDKLLLCAVAVVLGVFGCVKKDNATVSKIISIATIVVFILAIILQENYLLAMFF